MQAEFLDFVFIEFLKTELLQRINRQQVHTRFHDASCIVVNVLDALTTLQQKTCLRSFLVLLLMLADGFDAAIVMVGGPYPPPQRSSSKSTGTGTRRLSPELVQSQSHYQYQYWW
jgi:hypothetical protein